MRSTTPELSCDSNQWRKFSIGQGAHNRATTLITRVYRTRWDSSYNFACIFCKRTIHFSLVPTTPLGSTLNRLVRKTYMVNFSYRRLYMQVIQGYPFTRTHAAEEMFWKWYRYIVIITCPVTIHVPVLILPGNGFVRPSTGDFGHLINQPAMEMARPGPVKQAEQAGTNRANPLLTTCLQQCRLISARAAKGSNRVRHKGGT